MRHLLDVLAQKNRPIGIRALSREVSLAPSTTQRLMTGLQSQGFVAQTLEKKWILGTELILLGLNALHRCCLPSPDASLFEALEKECEALFSLGIRLGKNVALLSKSETRILPLHHSPAGIALLGCENQETISAYMTQNVLAGTERENLFLQCMSLVKNGWVADFKEGRGYLVAVPVTDREGSKARASLALSFPDKTFCSTQALEKLLATARRLQSPNE